MDTYEQLLEVDDDGICLDFADSQNRIEEWIETEYTAYMSRKCLSVITDVEFEVIRLTFGLPNDEPRSYDEIAAIMNLSKNMVSKIYHQAIRKIRHPREIGIRN